MIKCLTGAVIKTLGLLSKSKISDYYWIPKGDELLIWVSITGGSGPARAWGHVKMKKKLSL